MLIVVEFKELSALRCFECLADGCFATVWDLLDVRCVTRETSCSSAKRLVLGIYAAVRTDSSEETLNLFRVRRFDVSILNQSRNSGVPLIFGPRGLLLIRTVERQTESGKRIEQLRIGVDV